MLPENVIDRIARLQGRILATGSRVICNPAPTDTDEDWVVNVNGKDKLLPFRNFLLGDGWELSTGEEYISEEEDIFSDLSDGNGFASFKKAVEGTIYNIILVPSLTTFRSWVIATGLAKALNLADKTERIELFQAIVHDNCMYIPPSLTLDQTSRRPKGTDMYYSTVQIYELKDKT